MEARRTTSIIKRVDQFLLKNYPVTWSTRIHKAGLYSLGFAIFLALISFVAADDPQNKSMIHYWTVLISIISLLAFVFWMIYLLRFNVFKRFGTWKATDTVKTFFFYFIIIVIMLSWPFIPPVVESVKANAAYSTDELVSDINNINIKICQLEQDSIDTRFQRDTFQIDNSVRMVERRRYSIVDSVEAPDNDHYYLIDTTQLRERLEAADSVKKITDSIYVIYKCPNYQFIYDYIGPEYEYGDDEDRALKILSSIDLYRHILQNKQVIDKEKVRGELDQLLAKYNTYHDRNTSASMRETYHNYGEIDDIAKIKDRYDLYFINQQIDNITDKKFRWDKGTIHVSSRIVYYIALGLAMLVLIYRHTTKRTFFLSLLAAVVLTILTSLFIAMSPNNQNAFYIWTIFYFMAFIVIAAFIFKSKYRNVVTGIGLNLLVVMTPFMPLIITAFYYELVRQRYWRNIDREGSQYIDNPEQYKQLFANEKLHMFLAEIGGGILLFILLATVYQMAYKKWFASPEQ